MNNLEKLILVIVLIIFVGFSFYHKENSPLKIIEANHKSMIINYQKNIIIVNKDSFDNNKKLKKALEVYEIDYDYIIKFSHDN